MASEVGLGNHIVTRALDSVKESLAIFRVISEESINDLSLRCFSHPLEEGEVAELIGAEDLEHLNWLITNVLNKVAHVARHDTYISREIVKGTGVTLGGKDGDSRTALDEERPLIRIRMPMHLANSAGFDNGVGGRDGLGDGEICRISDSDLSAAICTVDRILLEHSVGEIVLGLLGLLSTGCLFIN